MDAICSARCRMAAITRQRIPPDPTSPLRRKSGSGRGRGSLIFCHARSTGERLLSAVWHSAPVFPAADGLGTIGGSLGGSGPQESAHDWRQRYQPIIAQALGGCTVGWTTSVKKRQNQSALVYVLLEKSAERLGDRWRNIISLFCQRHLYVITKYTTEPYSLEQFMKETIALKRTLNVAPCQQGILTLQKPKLYLLNSIYTWPSDLGKHERGQ